MSTEQNKFQKSNSVLLISVSMILLIAALGLHIVPYKGTFFPKENFTFSNTFIFKSNVDALLERHNNASFLDKMAIKQEPLFRKLYEQGIIYEDDSDKE